MCRYLEAICQLFSQGGICIFIGGQPVRGLVKKNGQKSSFRYPTKALKFWS